MNSSFLKPHLLPRQKLVDAIGIFCASGYGVLAYLARQIGEPDLLVYYGIVVWTAAPVLALFLYLVRREESFPVSRLFLWAIVFRLCGFLGGPFYEDDFYRYLWDGYRFWKTGTPYGVAPEAFFVDQSVPIALQGALDQINNPDLPTIYGPTAQLLFLLGYVLKAGSVYALQGLLIIVDLTIIYLLTRLTTIRNAMLYAWCPLVIKEIAFTAHPDALGVCLVLAAIVLVRRDRYGFAAVCLGLAVGAKLFALVVVPFVLYRAPHRYWLYFLLTLGALYAPFLLFGATDVDSLIMFAQEWEFNSSIFAILSLFIPATISKLTLGVAFFILVLYLLRRHGRVNNLIPRGDWLFGSLFVLSPVFNAWYMLWVLPFAAIFPSRWAWTASVALLLTYITGLQLGDYELQPYAQPLWVRFTEFGVIALALVWDVQRNRPNEIESEEN
ncbi:MAG: glycosyltransferase family 87 protein [Gammaproteobacteria bacterium]|nr:glycosyltransferase family 87 protein [Gammaproteobacteria bacterium]